MKACEGVDTVFHTVAVITTLGGSSVTHEYRNRAHSINVEGTRNVIRACQHHGVKRLVHTSSDAVVFEGTPVPLADSTTPYAVNPYDMYSQTKIAAELEVLGANGVDGVLTCAIRPGGIWGPQSCVMLDRFVEQAEAGMLKANLGDPESQQSNTYIDNLVHGEILAAGHLLADSPVCGRAYFITDDDPMNYFAFFRPLIEGIGLSFPRLWVPLWTMLPILRIWQWLYFRNFAPAPLLTPIELQKISITNYSTISDAHRDLGYEPVVSTEEGIEHALAYCRNLYDRKRQERSFVERPHVGWWISIFLGMTVLGLISLNEVTGAWFQSNIPFLGTVPISVWRIVFLIALALHVGEGIYAWRAASRAGLKRARGWGMQTLLLGWPSTRLLRKEIREQAENGRSDKRYVT